MIASDTRDVLESDKCLSNMDFIKMKARLFRDRFELLSELIGFLWEYKLWWMVPIIIVMVVFTSMILFVQGTGLAPFIYPLF